MNSDSRFWIEGEFITVVDLVREESYFYFANTLHTPILADGMDVQVYTQIKTSDEDLTF